MTYTITWYKANGTAYGTLSHWYNLYEDDHSPFPVMGYCANKYTVS